MTKPAPEALADFLTEYRRDNVTSVSCANLFDAAADMLRTQSTEVANKDAVIEAARKLQADMISRADVGTYDGDHSVQAGATVWWVFCERLKDLDTASSSPKEPSDG